MTLQTNPGVRSFFEFLSVPLSARVRWLLLAFVALVLASYWFPLWRISMVAPQYPKGLFLDIFSWKLEGGNAGRDLDEINILNHYIGMRRIVREELVDLNWLPFAFGGLALLALRTALLGTIRTLVDLAVLTGYVSGFALFRFVWMLHTFGHDLDEKAPMNIEPFTPAILGKKQVANFITHSWPLPGSWMILGFACGLWVVTAIALWEGRRAARGGWVPGNGSGRGTGMGTGAREGDREWAENRVRDSVESGPRTDSGGTRSELGRARTELGLGSGLGG